MPKRSQVVWLFMFMSLSAAIGVMGYGLYQDGTQEGIITAQAANKTAGDRLIITYQKQVALVLTKPVAAEKINALLAVIVPAEYQSFHFQLVTALEQKKDPPALPW